MNYAKRMLLPISLCMWAGLSLFFSACNKPSEPVPVAKTEPAPPVKPADPALVKPTVETPPTAPKDPAPADNTVTKPNTDPPASPNNPAPNNPASETPPVVRFKEPEMKPLVPLVPKDPPEQKPLEPLAPAQPPEMKPLEPVATTKKTDRPDKHAPVDLTKLEPIFVGWEKPALALVISGEQDGYMEPCGCAGFDNMKGGLTRRHSFIKEKQEAGWNLVGLDVGGQLKRTGKQAELQFNNTVDSLKAMGYQAIGLGVSDLRIDSQNVLGTVADASFVSANVVVEDTPEATPPVRIIKEAGFTIGVTAVLSDKSRKQVVNASIKTKPAVEALNEVLAKPELKNCDYRVLLSYGSVEESTELAKKFPQFQFVITAGGGAEPPKTPTKISGTKTLLLETGIKGAFVVVVGLYDKNIETAKYQRVPMDARFKESPQILVLKGSLQDQLKELGFEGLGLKPGNVQHPTGRQFIGSETCGDCHTKAYDIWKKTPHAKATKTLVDLKPARQFDPECISCHVTGWEPQKFFPFASGFLALEKTPKLADNGCENCHGPGKEHADAENAENTADSKLKTLRQQMRLKKAEARANCVACHDLDNSPNFDFDKYWPEVEHKGKD